MKCQSRYLIAIGASCLGLLAAPGLSWGSAITSNPLLPPDTGIYLSPDDVHAQYSGPGLAIILKNITHQPFASQASRHASGPNEIEDFPSEATGTVSVNGSPDAPISLNGPVQTEVFGKIGNTTGTFNTEMLSMNLNGNSPFGPVMIRESPTLQSTGQTSITDIGGGLYRIDSFFDVFTELSVDGGQTWMPDQQGPVHMTLETPEPASLALLALGTLGLISRRRSV